MKREVLKFVIGFGIILMTVTVLFFFNPVDAASLKPSETPAGNILFHDDFETYSNRWTLSDSPKSSVKYFEGTLRVRIVSPGVAIWSVPDFDLPLKDYRLEVDAQFLDGGADAQFGFVLDYADEDNFYAFVTLLNGDWLFLHQDSGEWIDLTADSAETVESDSDTSMIHLTVEIIDDSLKLYLDDQLVGSMTDESLAGGLFGLYARAGKGYADVTFDNIVLTDITGAK